MYTFFGGRGLCDFKCARQHMQVVIVNSRLESLVPANKNDVIFLVSYSQYCQVLQLSGEDINSLGFPLHAESLAKHCQISEMINITFRLPCRVALSF